MSQELIEQIRAGENTEAIANLYGYFPVIERFIVRYGGSKEEAMDVFQESLVILYKNARKKDFELTSSVETYLFSICKYLWKDQLRRKNRQVPYSTADHLHEEEEVKDHLESEQQYQTLDRILESLGEKCKTLLKMFYYEKLSMKDIAQRLKYGSIETAKTRKYKCLERARKLAASEKAKTLI